MLCLLLGLAHLAGVVAMGKHGLSGVMEGELEVVVVLRQRRRLVQAVVLLAVVFSWVEGSVVEPLVLRVVVPCVGTVHYIPGADPLLVDT